jgi:hypothetical protein
MKIIAIIVCLSILVMLAFGCAGTTDKVADGLNAFADAHEMVQRSYDSMHELCSMATSQIKDEKALGEILELCSDMEEAVLKYKELSDPVIEALKKE